MRILILEDQVKTLSFLSKGLKSAGYACDESTTLNQAQELVIGNEYDALIVDINIPDGDGISFVRQVRQDGFRGVIIFLTALATTDYKIQGLDAGGDDYITKPFSIEELLARLRAQLRKNQKATEGNSILKFGDVEMDLVKRRVLRKGISLDLSVKEFALLEYFLRNPERPLSRALISEHVWNIDFDPESNIIDVYVNHLRRKLEVENAPRVIHTVTGVGYELGPPQVKSK